MPALHISPSEIHPTFDTDLPPRVGASIQEWIAYRARKPRVALLAPPVVLPWTQKEEAPAPSPGLILTPLPDIPHHLLPDVLTGAMQTFQTRSGSSVEVLRPIFVDGKPPVRFVITVCAAYYGYTRDKFLGPRRTLPIVRPRQVGMYLAKLLCEKSLPEIGRWFGGRDHTTILNGVRKIGATIEVEKSLRADVEAIKLVIMGGEG